MKWIGCHLQTIMRALKEKRDLRSGWNKKDLMAVPERDSPEKKITHQSRRHDRTTDIEDTKEVQSEVYFVVY